VAMMTGKTQTHAMRIYAVSHSGRLSDVTSQTTCHSGDDEALKVCLFTDGRFKTQDRTRTDEVCIMLVSK